MCDCSKNSIYAYESNLASPHYTIIEKICVALGVGVEYFQDDYYSFVLSEKYVPTLQRWRRENTKRHTDIKRKLGVSYAAYVDWERGCKMTRKTFEKIRQRGFNYRHKTT